MDFVGSRPGNTGWPADDYVMELEEYLLRILILYNVTESFLSDSKSYGCTIKSSAISKVCVDSQKLEDVMYTLISIPAK